jgi:predicted O-methyltransferase YrrM
MRLPKISKFNDRKSYLYDKISECVSLVDENMFSYDIIGSINDPNTNYARDNVIFGNDKRLNQHYVLLFLLSAKLQPKSILEIGIYKGYSVHAMLYGISLKENGLNNVFYTGVDNLSYINNALTFTREKVSKFLQLDSNTLFLISSSKTALPYLIDSGKKYDLIFIDGDHTYNGASYDWLSSEKLLDNNGVIVFDDVNMDDLPKLVDEKCSRKNWDFVVLETNHTGIAFFQKNN